MLCSTSFVKKIKPNSSERGPEPDSGCGVCPSWSGESGQKHTGHEQRMPLAAGGRHDDAGSGGGSAVAVSR